MSVRFIDLKSARSDEHLRTAMVWDFARLPAHHQAVVEWTMIAVMTGRLLASDDPRDYLARAA